METRSFLPDLIGIDIYDTKLVLAAVRSDHSYSIPGSEKLSRQNSALNLIR
jgi:hypothetical protein